MADLDTSFRLRGSIDTDNAASYGATENGGVESIVLLHLHLLPLNAKSNSEKIPN